MTPALLLACGNPLRGDDGFGGWMAAQGAGAICRLSTGSGGVAPIHSRDGGAHQHGRHGDLSSTVLRRRSPGQISLHPVEATD